MQERSVEMLPASHMADESAQAKAVSSPRHAHLAQLKADIAGSTRITAQRQQLAQLKGMPTAPHGKKEKVPVQGKFVGAQLKGAHKKKPLQKMEAPTQLKGMRKEKPVQKQAMDAPVQKQEPEPANRTGLPAQLKQGVEALSGMSMDHVRVHYNSSKPAQLQAHAYAQGGEIHVGPGQEEHLPHEAWHVVQQTQGRVKPTMQMKAGVLVNDDVALEAEADLMGARTLMQGAVQMRQQPSIGILNIPASPASTDNAPSPSGQVSQLVANHGVANGPRICNRMIVQREKFPEHRIDQHIFEPTDEEEAAFKERYNFGDNGTGNEDRERKDMLNRAEYAKALDDLAAVEDYYDPLDKAGCRSADLETYYAGALTYYKGTREPGHEIWLGLQTNLRYLLESGFAKGYAINRGDIQKLMLNAALAKTMLESNALGSAGRSVTFKR